MGVAITPEQMRDPGKLSFVEVRFGDGRGQRQDKQGTGAGGVLLPRVDIRPLGTDSAPPGNTIDTVMQNVLGWVVAAVAVVVALFIGYFRGYLTQKGQNLVTHEDIEELVDQLRAVTTATKEIEARISNEVWDRQKRWELKRDLLIEMVKKTMALQVALQRLQAVRLTSKGTNSPEDR